ncbi:cytokine receptor common subunit gamma-like [Epinephelus fuscoguttatus]|uniref:cytokine receptor common subunit gamma-like n=1 Tax=Epinephelus fuscoguttatus TaxID=293821 RepID=UPI0020D06120|nr:cytokine receptor common subunit gamma-like [Epinephelus fuscoguttatus]
MLPTGLFLLLCLAGHVFAKELPDVDCLLVHLKYVHCSWNKQGTPEVNYTFYGWFHGDEVVSECPTYLSENNINTGCNQPYDDSISVRRFTTFYTRLVHGEDVHQKEHYLKDKVKLNPPPANVSDQIYLCLTWTQILPNCVESEARYRISDSSWETSRVRPGMQEYCINMPSAKSLVELQVRSKMDSACGGSLFWSEWSEPVVWGSNKSTVYPMILNSSKCELQSVVLTCVCISEGFPLPTIRWPLLKNQAEYSVTTTVSNHTVNSTLTLTVKDHSNISIECVSSNEGGESKADIIIITSERREDEHGLSAVPLLTVVAVVSLTVNVLCMIPFIFLWITRKKVKPKQEDRTYMSLKKTETSPEYDVIGHPLS